MKVESFYRLKEGDTLTLKPERQQAYGKILPHVKFKSLRENKGYKTPYVVCECGIYQPRDFKG